MDMGHLGENAPEVLAGHGGAWFAVVGGPDALGDELLVAARVPQQLLGRLGDGISRHFL